MKMRTTFNVKQKTLRKIVTQHPEHFLVERIPTSEYQGDENYAYALLCLSLSALFDGTSIFDRGGKLLQVIKLLKPVDLNLLVSHDAENDDQKADTSSSIDFNHLCKRFAPIHFQHHVNV
jgi:hypothetical protein